MATAQTLIDRSLRLIGALESGESPTAQETADVLIALNAMIDSWRNDDLLVYGITEVSKVLTPADGGYTIGASANIDTTRPVKIEGARVTVSGVDYPCEVITEAQWRAIDYKTTQGIPCVVYYDPQMATGTVNLWPVPDAAYTLVLSLWTPIATLATAGTTVTLPPGYERALTSNLAIEIAPEFQKGVPAALEKTARESLKAIKRTNVRPFYADISEVVCMHGGGQSGYDIVTGD